MNARQGGYRIKTRKKRKPTKKAGAKKPARGKALIPLLSRPLLKRRINRYEKMLETLRSPAVKDVLLSGRLPSELKSLSLKAAQIELIADVTPDEYFLPLGIWLPHRSFLRKKTNWPLYYAYWKLGPYFLPVHAVLRFASEYLPDRIKRAPQLRAGRMLRKRFSAKETEIRITNEQYREFVAGLEGLLERTKEGLKE